MLRRAWLAWPVIVLLLLAAGCGSRGVKRAPIDTIPEDVDDDTRLELLEAMALEYPNDANVYYELGNLYYDDVLPVDARNSYDKALSLDPAHNMARVNLAMLLAESDEPDSAKILLEQAIELDPDDAKAYSNLGMVYYTELDVARAVDYLTKAIELDPKSAEAHYNLGLAFAESGLLLEAIREWRLVLELVPESDTAQRARLSLDRANRVLKE